MGYLVEDKDVILANLWLRNTLSSSLYNGFTPSCCRPDFHPFYLVGAMAPTHSTQGHGYSTGQLDCSADSQGQP